MSYDLDRRNFLLSVSCAALLGCDSTVDTSLREQKSFLPLAYLLSAGVGALGAYSLGLDPVGGALVGISVTAAVSLSQRYSRSVVREARGDAVAGQIILQRSVNEDRERFKEENVPAVQELTRIVIENGLIDASSPIASPLQQEILLDSIDDASRKINVGTVYYNTALQVYPQCPRLVTNLSDFLPPSYQEQEVLSKKAISDAEKFMRPTIEQYVRVISVMRAAGVNIGVK